MFLCIGLLKLGVLFLCQWNGWMCGVCLVVYFMLGLLLVWQMIQFCLFGVWKKLLWLVVQMLFFIDFVNIGWGDLCQVFGFIGLVFVVVLSRFSVQLFDQQVLFEQVRNSLLVGFCRNFGFLRILWLFCIFYVCVGWVMLICGLVSVYGLVICEMTRLLWLLMQGEQMKYSLLLSLNIVLLMLGWLVVRVFFDIQLVVVGLVVVFFSMQMW